MSDMNPGIRNQFTRVFISGLAAVFSIQSAIAEPLIHKDLADTNARSWISTCLNRRRVRINCVRSLSGSMVEHGEPDRKGECVGNPWWSGDMLSLPSITDSASTPHFLLRFTIVKQPFDSCAIMLLIMVSIRNDSVYGVLQPVATFPLLSVLRVMHRNWKEILESWINQVMCRPFVTGSGPPISH